MNTQTAVHFADKYILQPTNPLIVNVIGAGGTGSELMAKLAKMNVAMTALGHPGMQVSLYDDDRVTEANLARQEFASSELGMFKSVVLINRINRFRGTNWKAVPQPFRSDNFKRLPDGGMANIFISCTDTSSSRFDIAKALRQMDTGRNSRNKLLYWMDLGNQAHTGQVILSTINPVSQPESQTYRTVSVLPQITDEFADLLEAQQDNNEPSCSAAEALLKQDLFINPSIAIYGARLLWQFFRNGFTEDRGIFVNLDTLQTQPLKVG